MTRDTGAKFAKFRASEAFFYARYFRLRYSFSCIHTLKISEGRGCHFADHCYWNKLLFSLFLSPISGIFFQPQPLLNLKISISVQCCTIFHWRHTGEVNLSKGGIFCKHFFITGCRGYFNCSFFYTELLGISIRYLR